MSFYGHVAFTPYGQPVAVNPYGHPMLVNPYGQPMLVHPSVPYGVPYGAVPVQGNSIHKTYNVSLSGQTKFGPDGKPIDPTASPIYSSTGAKVVYPYF